MVVDQPAQLVRDRAADLADVVEPVQLVAEALQHLHVRERADVVLAPVDLLDGPLGGAVAVDDDLDLPLAFAVIIADSAQATSSRGFIACSGPCAMPIETVTVPASTKSIVSSRCGEPVGEASGARGVGGRDDHRELLAADPADGVRAADGRAQMVGELGEDPVADAVPVDVVDALEVVDVEHHDADGLVGRRRARQLAAEALVEVAVVVEAGERVGLRLQLEPGADVRVVERERGGVAEAASELELLGSEARVLALAVDVERPLEAAAGDERDDDERLRLDRRARHEADARVEVRLVREHRLAVRARPAGDALAERELGRSSPPSPTWSARAPGSAPA